MAAASATDTKPESGPAIEFAVALLDSAPPTGPVVRGVPGCDGGEIYDDGTAENGYSGNPAVVSDAQITQRFTPATYPSTYTTACIALVSLAGDNLNFVIEVRDDDGPGGTPGTLLGSVPASATGIPGGLPCQFYSFDISSMGLNVANGSVFIGTRHSPVDFPSRFVCADQSATTPLNPGFINFNNPSEWQPTQNLFPDYRAMLIRAVSATAQPQLNLGAVTTVDMCASAPTNNNGIIEPGESVTVTVPLSASAGGFTNVAGVLSSTTPGVTVVNGVGTYGNIAEGATASASYTIALAESVACGGDIALNLAVSSTEDNFSFPITRPVGQAATINYAGLPAPIPDNSPGTGASSTATVSGVPGPLSNLEVQVNVAHTWVGDVILTLTSPSGAVITLLDRPGFSGTGFGCGNDNINVRFADGQPDPEGVCAASGAWPVSDAAPVTPFSTLDGIDANGTWTLTATDSASGDTGSILSWELFITPAPEGTCTVCAGTADLSLTKTAAAPSPLNLGNTITYTLTVANAGPSAAAGVVVTDTLPSNVTYVSNTCGATVAGGTVTWNVGALANGANASCNVVVTVSGVGAIVNNASVASSTLDPTPGNNASSATLAGATPRAAIQVTAVGPAGLALLILLMGAFGVILLRRH